MLQASDLQNPDLLEYDGQVDLGKEISMLHGLLIETLDKVAQLQVCCGPIPGGGSSYSVSSVQFHAKYARSAGVSHFFIFLKFFLFFWRNFNL